MAFRTAVVIASVLIGLGALARESCAQYYPSQAYPPPRDYPLPPVDADDDAPLSPRYAALPPEVRPETGSRKELPPQFRRTLIDYYTKQPAGTIVIDTPNTYLYLVLGNGKALRYGIRSEEHTYELQSLRNLVCRLLLDNRII